MSTQIQSADRFRRARVEYAVVDGELRGTVVLPGGDALRFANAAELEHCLGQAAPRLMLVDATETPRAEEGLASLSATERAIVRTALSGASNREIANAYFYSVKSVEAYLTRIYRRLGVEGRAGLQMFADELDDLELPEEEAEMVTGGGASAPSASTGVRSVVVELLLL
jgi:DNA-binding CsgD family transcriptional regulator